MDVEWNFLKEFIHFNSIKISKISSQFLTHFKIIIKKKKLKMSNQKQLQYFTQFGHMAELSESELVMEKRTNSQAK